MTEEGQPRFDAVFWFQWIVATTMGWLLGSALFPMVAIVAGGIGAGLLQTPVLYRRLDKAWMWPLTGSAGWVLGWLAALAVVPANMGFLAGLLAGAAAGTAQWLYLRRRLRWSGWWIPVTALAWTSALSILPGMLMSGVTVGAMSGIALDLLLHNLKPVATQDKEPAEMES